MSHLIATPITDKNGKSTTVHKRPDVYVAARTTPMPPAPVQTYTDDAEYVFNNYDGNVHSDAEIQAEIEITKSYFLGIETAMDTDSDWLPPVENKALYADDEDADEEDSYIAKLADLKDPLNSRGTCGIVSESVAEYVQKFIADGVDIDFVQGMSEPHRELNVHYANLFTRKSGVPALIVDFTFSQVDPHEQSFPFIATPEEWQRRINVALSSL